MKFGREIVLAGLVSAMALPSAWAETKKSTTSAPAPVVRAAPAPAPVMRAPAPVVRAPVVRAPAPVVRAAPAPVVRAPVTTAAKPATTSVAAKPATPVKPAATTPVKPATVTAVKPATPVKPTATAAVKPATTTATTTKPATATATTATPLERSRNRIQSELPADGAVRADTARKPDMNGVRADEFKPKQAYRKPVEVPGPGTPNFPKRAPNDPAPTNPLSR